MSKRKAADQLAGPAKRARPNLSAEEVHLRTAVGTNLACYILQRYTPVHWLDVKVRPFIDDSAYDQRRFGKPFLARDDLIGADLAHGIVRGILWTNTCTAERIAPDSYLTGDLIEQSQ